MTFKNSDRKNRYASIKKIVISHNTLAYHEVMIVDLVKIKPNYYKVFKTFQLTAKELVLHNLDKTGCFQYTTGYCRCFY